MIEDPLRRAMARLREEPQAPEGFEERIVEAIRHSEAGRRRRRYWVTGSGLAALLVGAVLSHRSRPTEPTASGVPVRFEITLPRAATVSVVGDFNEWNPSRTPLTREGDTERWTVSIPLGAGLYQYAYLVNGQEWVGDPARPGVSDPDFGVPVSILHVAGRS